MRDNVYHVAAGQQEVAGADRIDPDLRPLLDHIAAELAQEYIRPMEAAADEVSAAAGPSVADA
jgi:hypothetical protein